MVLNTIHDYSEDYITCENLTKKKKFRCSVLDSVDYSKFEAITGIPKTKIKLALRVNGWCEISERDVIKTPLEDRKFTVIQVLARYDNNIQFRKRKDVGNFTGDCDIYLE